MRKGQKLSEEVKARSRHQSLLWDYGDLVEETEAKRKKLQIANQKKLKLLAEVKFLQRRYKSLSQNPSGTKQLRLKKKSQSQSLIGQPSNANAYPQLPAKDQRSKLRDADTPCTSALIDLNQIGEDTEEYPSSFSVEPMKSDKLRKSLVEDNSVANDLNLSICRDVVHESSNKVAKRKITWQDQLALRV
ncbi:uncharacterized protein LOC121976537 isoform X2 [Zingiber officinale]|uniref:uncharacterized protein LOC121971136 isoform X2 n=1 Tax=Zingiber officinale TaxID=94328 RepID=UPI001C4CF46F|nr:uncharacterized protein LOC121971136 isoform X2 [Zingiber officinale]XP_042384665.1 uncharacterized protein LOC121976537 isoform X2 [Zingiber officinale]